MEKYVRLRSDVYFEPLFNKWFMWPYLLAPAQAAMNLANHHLRVMRSFVTNSQIHAKAAGGKSLAGASLVGMSADRVGEIKVLINSTVQRYADLIEFADAVRALDELLISEAKGMSLEPLYPRIPNALRGFVELTYDLNNQPSFRFIEGLLYQSSYYKPQAQSVGLGILRSSERPFVLSTPRLADDRHLHVNVPLAHEFVDVLFSMRSNPRPLSSIKGLMTDLTLEGDLVVDDLFTAVGSPPPQAYCEDGVQIRYLGHAGLLIQTRASSLMIDPVISYRNDDVTDKTTFDDLPARIDYVLITHSHMDHACLETLVQLRHRIGSVLVPKNNSGNLADPSLKLMLRAIGFARVEELEDMESVVLDDGYLMALPFLGEHADVNVRSKTAWFVNVLGRRILAAADSSSLDERLYDHLHEITGDIDVLFVGMECTGAGMRWLYGALLTRGITHEQNESRRFSGSDFKSASLMVRAFNAAQVYVYAMGVEPWFGYFMGLAYGKDDVQLAEARRLIDDCRGRGIPAERLEGLKILRLPAGDRTCAPRFF